MTDSADDPLRTLRLCDSALKSQHSDGIPVFAHFVVNHPRRKCRGGVAHLKCKCKIGEDFRGRINPHLKCKCKIGEDLSFYRHLIRHLHLGGMIITSAGPYLRRAGSGARGRKGCQIDLLIQTRRTICVVEVKRMREIGREIIGEVDRKVCAIKRPQGVSVRTALVYDGHLAPIVSADGYFDAIVPFSALLGLGTSME